MTFVLDLLVQWVSNHAIPGVCARVSWRRGVVQGLSLSSGELEDGPSCGGEGGVPLQRVVFRGKVQPT